MTDSVECVWANIKSGSGKKKKKKYKNENEKEKLQNRLLK